jgi:ketosteroid isomerase-like protein
MDITAQTETIIDTIKSMNRCWTAGWDEPAFRQYIHPDAVAIVPTTPGRLEGKDAYVAGWRAFVEAAVIHEWRENDHKVHLYNGSKSAVITYLFSITFVTGTQKNAIRGRDMLFLVKSGRKWQVVADQFSPDPVDSEVFSARNTPVSSS